MLLPVDLPPCDSIILLNFLGLDKINNYLHWPINKMQIGFPEHKSQKRSYCVGLQKITLC